MKKDELIKVLNDKYKWDIKTLKEYTVKGLEYVLVNGELLDSMKRKNLKKTKKTSIPKTLKNKVWDKYIGKEKGIGNCYCCDKNIDSKHFEAGHVVAEANNGETILNNLRPICSCCNKSVGVKNLDEFKKKYMKTDTIKKTNATKKTDEIMDYGKIAINIEKNMKKLLKF